ncbi:hypothetical protein KAW50_05545 [candidate division WOR-3 bacterium]|nr:hypothetical protein [candidate division WOR-3 bacterium]
MYKVIKLSVFLGLFISCGLLEAQTKFRLFCYKVPTTPSALSQCYSSLTFDEYTITWDNRPPKVKFLSEIDDSAISCWHEWSSPELTAYVDSCIAFQEPIVFCVKRTTTGFCSDYWAYYCREQSSTQCPQLIHNGKTYSPPEKDARVDEHKPNTNFCCDFLWTCTCMDGWKQESFIQFTAPISGTEEGSHIKRMRFLRSTPSPFSSFTRISYNLLAEDAGKPTVLRVYDVAGKLIRNLVNAPGSSGRHEVVWDAKDEEGNLARPGCYFYRLKVGKATLTTKAILLR